MTRRVKTEVPAIRRLRWRILLPVLMTTVAASLMVLAQRQQPTLRTMGTGSEVPARVVNSVINGPGFYLGRLIPIPVPYAIQEKLRYDADRIVGIAVFWFLLGLSIDRRRNQQVRPLEHAVIAAVLFGCAAVLSGVVAFTTMFNTICPNFSVVGCPRPDLFWRVLSRYPLRTWETMYLGLGVWLMGFCFYFARRTFIVVRTRQSSG